MATMTPNQIMAISGVMPGTSPGRIFSATGANSGSTMNAISKKSMNMPRMNTRMLTTIRKPQPPPGILVNRCSIQMWPSAELKVKLNTVEPIRMNSTKEASLAVFSSACLSSGMDRRLLPMARINAPKAPMAPPSVGVATPRKMVPSTKKIRISGGINTNVTCSASLESSAILETRLMMASSRPVMEANVKDMMTISSPAEGSERSSQRVSNWSCTWAQPQPTAAQMRNNTSSDL